MFRTLQTLLVGANARAEEAVRTQYAIELIEQKIREATAQLKSAKLSLAGLIQRKRAETRQADAVQTRIDDLSTRIKPALEAGEDTLAQEAATAIAALENELEARRETLQKIDSRAVRLETSVDTAHRRLIDLKQGAMTAKVTRREQDMQAKLGHHGTHAQTAMDEAEALIADVLSADDPLERSEILSDIEASLSHDTIATRMAEKGLGASTKTTARDVLARFK